MYKIVSYNPSYMFTKIWTINSSSLAHLSEGKLQEQVWSSFTLAPPCSKIDLQLETQFENEDLSREVGADFDGVLDSRRDIVGLLWWDSKSIAAVGAMTR